MEPVSSANVSRVADVEIGEKSVRERDRLWREWVGQLAVPPFVRMMADNSTLILFEGEMIEIVLDPVHTYLHNNRREQQLLEALRIFLQKEVGLKINLTGDVNGRDTPALLRQQESEQQQQQAEEDIAADPVVRAMQSIFSAVIEKGSIRPIKE